jgi:hypothetical protein
VAQPKVLLPLAAAAAGLALVQAHAAPYLFHQGFPLDDAWIHAVYAREFARSGMLAYNPGVAATGETSPLWAIVTAIVHVVAHTTPAIVAGTKLLGLALHAATAIVLGLAIASVASGCEWLAWLAAALVAIDPDLVAASVSGMEVPLATFVAAIAALGVFRGRPRVLAAAGALAFAARPETALLAVLLPLLYWARAGARRAARLALAGGAGGIACLTLFAFRNLFVSGRWLPATFYVKANTRSLVDPTLQRDGFVRVFGELAIVGHVWLVVVALSAALVLLASTRPFARAAGALYVSGIVFCAVSFALTPPIDPDSFYHQRYILPALPFIVAALPLLAAAVVSSSTRAFAARWSGAVAAALCLASALHVFPARARRLSNDARNIDDVQVAFGRALANARPDDVAWVVDAGASRFFGRAFVVDLIGLNTPALLMPDAQSFLDRHAPAFLDLFPT